MKAIRFAPQQTWIKVNSGNTYICPVGTPKNLPESELKKRCVIESDNPQNN